MRTFRILSLVLTVLASIPASAQLATTVNDNSLTPAAPAGALNVVPQNDGGHPTVNISHYATYPTNQVRCQPSGELSVPILQCLNWLGTAVGGICDARACYGIDTWTGNLNINVENATILFPCAQITMSGYLTVNPGIRNTVLHGCTYQGGSTANGDSGGTLFNWTANGTAFRVGDPTYATNTSGFVMDNININTSGSNSTAHAFDFWRTQEIRLENLSLNGDSGTGQTAINLDGTGNYTAGLFLNNHIQQFNTAFLLTGHQSGSVSDDYANASTFVKNHIDCPTSGSSPIAGTYGINVLGGDGNTFLGGDIEGCDTTVHLASAATSNTFLGVRNERSNHQYVADSGSTFNYVATGGAFFTNQLTDNGSRNSWWDAFHRTANGLQGDWYASQIDSTITNHSRLGIGLGNERGSLTETQTDYGNRWILGLSDGTSGEQFWTVEDLINSVQRIAIAQYLATCTNCVTNVIINNPGLYSSSTPPTLSFAAGSGSGAAGTPVMYQIGATGQWEVISVTMTDNGTGYTANFTPTWSGSNQITAPNAIAEVTPAGGTNDPSIINAAGTGAVILNGSNNSGTGGVIIGSGGPSETTVATFDNLGDESIHGYLGFDDATQTNWEWECQTAAACTLQDYSATTPARVFKANVNGQTDVDSQGTSPVTINNTTTGGTGGFAVYGGGPSYYNTVLFRVIQTAGIAAYLFPSLASSSGYTCLQADDSGYLSKTGNPCGTGTGDGTMTSYNVTVPTDMTATDCGTSTSATCVLAWFNGVGPAHAALADAVPWSGITSVPGQFPGGATGNAASASALYAAPTTCSAGYVPTGIGANGNATGCAPAGQIQFSTAGSSLCTSSYCFMGTGYTGGSNYKGAFISPRTGTVQNCSLAVGFATTGTNYYTAVLFKNGAACTSGPTVTLNGGSHIVATDNTHTCTVAQGDQLTWQMTPTGTVTGDVGYGTCQY